MISEESLEERNTEPLPSRHHTDTDNASYTDTAAYTDNAAYTATRISRSRRSYEHFSYSYCCNDIPSTISLLSPLLSGDLQPATLEGCDAVVMVPDFVKVSVRARVSVRVRVRVRVRG